MRIFSSDTIWAIYFKIEFQALTCKHVFMFLTENNKFDFVVFVVFVLRCFWEEIKAIYWVTLYSVTIHNIENTFKLTSLKIKMRISVKVLKCQGYWYLKILVRDAKLLLSQLQFFFPDSSFKKVHGHRQELGCWLPV